MKVDGLELRLPRHRPEPQAGRLAAQPLPDHLRALPRLRFRSTSAGAGGAARTTPADRDRPRGPHRGHRLYACGEVACTGLHGANRLASNSLLERCVFAHRAAADACAATARDRATPRSAVGTRTGAANDESVVVTQNWDEIRRFMWNYVGIVRTTAASSGRAERILLLHDEVRAYYWNTLITSDLAELRTSPPSPS